MGHLARLADWRFDDTRVMGDVRVMLIGNVAFDFAAFMAKFLDNLGENIDAANRPISDL